MRPPPWSATERAWAEAVFVALFPEPPRSQLPAGASSLAVAGEVVALLDGVPVRQAIGVRLALWMVALAPPWVLGTFATIATLDVAQRERLVAELLASRVYVVRQLTLALKAMGALAFARAPAVRSAATSPRGVAGAAS